MFTPRASSTSAAPHLLEAARLPCLATGTPAAETTRAEVVEMLKELALVAAGAHDFQHVHVVEQLDAVLPHPGRRGGDLLDGLPLHAHGRQNRRSSGCRRPGRS